MPAWRNWPVPVPVPVRPAPSDRRPATPHPCRPHRLGRQRPHESKACPRHHPAAGTRLTAAPTRYWPSSLRWASRAAQPAICLPHSVRQPATPHRCRPCPSKACPRCHPVAGTRLTVAPTRYWPSSLRWARRTTRPATWRPPVCRRPQPRRRRPVPKDPRQRATPMASPWVTAGATRLSTSTRVRWSPTGLTRWTAYWTMATCLSTATRTG